MVYRVTKTVEVYLCENRHTRSLFIDRIQRTHEDLIWISATFSVLGSH